MNNHFATIENCIKWACVGSNAYEFYLELIILKIIQIFTFGNKKAKYRKRYKNIKKMLKEAKLYKKSLKRMYED